MHLPFGLGLFWRDNESIQLGFDEARSAVLDGLYPAEVPLLGLLSRPCTLTDVLAWARGAGVDASRAKKIFQWVADTGLAVTDTHPARMAPCEFAAASRAGEVDPSARAEIGVRILGAGLIGSVCALLLDAEGIGAVQIEDRHPLTGSQSRWLGATHIGEPIDQVLRPRLRGGGQPSRRITLSVSSRIIPRALAAECLAEDEPYLPIVIGESDITIGPFFFPGGPCHNCLDFHRRDADPSWPFLHTQATRLPGIEPDSTAALISAAWACSEIIELATHPYPRLMASQLHLPPPPGWPRVTEVSVHGECGCQIGGEAAGEHTEGANRAD
ncbi:MAG: hypothetical protein Q4P33_00745 [Flaviflexus sp.]|nr:hypothetical protein [Flaviflexus sp.]